MFFKKLVKLITPDFLLQIYYDYKNKNKTFYGHHSLDQKLCECPLKLQVLGVIFLKI